MSALNRPENFAGRVSYAAAVIAAGRPTTRSFDNCFENHDGDAVAAALVRRAAKNANLAANLWRYVSRESAEAAAAKLEGQNLTEAAALMRARRRFWRMGGDFPAFDQAQIPEVPAGWYDDSRATFADSCPCLVTPGGVRVYFERGNLEGPPDGPAYRLHHPATDTDASADDWADVLAFAARFPAAT